MMSSANGQVVNFPSSPSNKLVTPERSDQEKIANSAGTWKRVYTSDTVHPFDQIDWKIADARIVSPKGDIVYEQKNVEVPEWWNQTTINIVSDKYFRSVNGVRERSAKQIFTRVSSVITKWADEQNFFNTEEDAQIYEEELLYALVHQFGAFNSPVWFNLGVPGRVQAASACFISGVDDSLDDIMRFQNAELAIFRNGSGSGANLSKLRSSYEKLSSGSFTSGPLSFMKGNDAFAGAMKSGGSTRSAAKMLVMDLDHPDILDTKDGRPGFIKSKSFAEKMAHDLVSVGYSAAFDNPNSAYKLSPYQNANHSVSIPDSFMEAVKRDGVWETKERLTKKTVHTYKARELWNEIAEAAWICGDPGVQFNDTMNLWHTTPKSGRIRATNPCSEFTNSDNTACNLCAINLTKFFDGRKFVYDRFAQAVRLFSTAQLAIVDKAEYPTEEITKNSHSLRPIGLNYGNLGALLMNLGYGYDSDEGRAIAARLASLMTGTAYLVSAKLAARVGAFSDFEKNESDMLRVMNMHKSADLDVLDRWDLSRDPLGDEIAQKSADVWNNVIRLGSRFGYYSSQTTVQAPLGTVSFLMGMDTTGIEPAYSLVSYKSLVGGGSLKLVNSGVFEALKNLGYEKDQIDRIGTHIENNDTIEGAADLKSEHLPIFDCASASGNGARYLTPMAHLKIMAAIQPLITCAMSKTVNLPNSVTAKEIADIYYESWSLGLKCVALYRDGCKASQPLSSKKSDEEKTSSVIESVEVKPVDDVYIAKRDQMPSDVTGWRHRFEIDGYKGYLIVNEYENGRPGEVFLKLGKPGSTVSGLIDGFTQLVSIALQHGIPLPKLIESFIDTRFEPAGMTSNKEIRFAKSLYDYLFRYLDVHYYGGRYSGVENKIAEMRSVDTISDVIDLHEGITRETPMDSHPPAQKFTGFTPKKSLDAPPCIHCGGITQRAGSCFLCAGCGSTTGCS